MAHVAADYPLYYDAVNEKGVGMAGLNFVGNAYFPEVTEGKENVASFELIARVAPQAGRLVAHAVHFKGVEADGLAHERPFRRPPPAQRRAASGISSTDGAAG
jgi:hypothetical protein